MKKDLEPRFEKNWDDKPILPDPKKVKYAQELVDSTGDRYHYFPSAKSGVYYENDEEEEGSFPIRQGLSLKDINERVKQYGLDEKNIWLSASFRDDYLMIEVINVRKMSEEEKIEEYNSDLKEWNKIQEEKNAEEIQRLEYQMKALKAKAESLKK